MANWEAELINKGYQRASPHSEQNLGPLEYRIREISSKEGFGGGRTVVVTWREETE